MVLPPRGPLHGALASGVEIRLRTVCGPGILDRKRGGIVVPPGSVVVIVVMAVVMVPAAPKQNIPFLLQKTGRKF
jgi:hypothetical protein